GAVLASERAALRSERTRPDRTAAARSIARLWAAAWPGHPYAQTGAVPPASMDALTVADVDGWRRTQLVAGNAVLVITGAFDPDSALAAVKQQFGGRARTRALAPAAVTPRAGQRGQERFDAPVRFCLVGWRGPGAGDPDAAALEVLAAWLGGSPEARLSRSLVDDWKLAVVTQAGFAAQKDGSLLWTLVVVSPDADSSAVETTLLDAAGSVLRNAPQAFEVERTRRQLESSMLFALQTSRQRAQVLGEAELYAGDATAAARRIEALRRVTAADLQRAAARIMTDPSRAIVWMTPANTGGAR
ncbi:MAG: insulinase family protein, partial [Candidatus Eisenbacteria bacterium]